MNEPPLVEGTTAIAHVENEGRTLAGASYSATDPEGANVNWSVGGIDRGFFAISGSGVLSFADEPDFDARPLDDTYEVTVQATEEDDGDNRTRELTGSLAVTVTLSNFDEPPVITGPATVSDYPENSPTTRAVGRYTATDPERAGVTWSDLTGGNADDFELSNDGVLTFKASPNREEQDEYSVTLNAFDGSLTGRRTVTVTIVDVNEPPVVMRRSGTGDYSIMENSGTSVGGFDAMDPENRGVTWSLARSGDHGRFEIDDTNGVLSLKEPADYESFDLGSDKAYNVTVQATEEDDGDNRTRELTGSLPVTVAVTDVNEPPTSSRGTQTPSVRENTTAVATYSATDPERVTITWSLQGSNAGDFMLSSARALTFKSAPNYEAQTEHTVTVRASDGTNERRPHRHRHRDGRRRDRGAHALLAPAAHRHRLHGCVQGGGRATSCSRQRGRGMRSMSRSGRGTDIMGATAATYRPVADDRNHYLRVTASYNDGHGAKTLAATSDLPTAADPLTNTAPMFPSPLFTGGETGLSVRENATARTVVGVAPQATDTDGGTLSYSLVVPSVIGDPPFVINATSRQIRVAPGAALDHEDQDTYSVTVTVEDEFNATATATFDITIEDVNERPVAVADSAVMPTKEDTDCGRSPSSRTTPTRTRATP